MDGRGHGAARFGSLFPVGRSAGPTPTRFSAFLPMASHGMRLSDVPDVQADGPGRPPEPRRLKVPELWQERVAKALGTAFPVAVAGCGCQVAVAGPERAVGEFVETYDAVTATGTRAWAASAMGLWRGLDRKAATAVRDSFFDGYRAGVCAACGLDDDPRPSARGPCGGAAARPSRQGPRPPGPSWPPCGAGPCLSRRRARRCSR